MRGSSGHRTLLAAVMLANGFLGVAAGEIPHARAAGTCAGDPATIVGTESDDTIIGTPGDDVIDGLGGNDTINGGGGNDTVCGGAGNDTIDGADGTDECDGGPGTDTVTNCETTTNVP